MLNKRCELKVNLTKSKKEAGQVIVRTSKLQHTKRTEIGAKVEVRLTSRVNFIDDPNSLSVRATSMMSRVLFEYFGAQKKAAVRYNFIADV